MKEDHPDYILPENFQSHARDWGKLFMELFCDDDLTPYIHGMMIFHTMMCVLKVPIRYLS